MKKIGIIGAMDLEVDTLKSKMEVKRIVKKASREFYEGTLFGTEVVIVQCGVGKVNAGSCTQILADEFGVTHIINTGIAGSLNNEINIGDIVISTDAVYHDMNVSVFGYEVGRVPGLDTVGITADERMASLAKEVCERVNPDIKVFRGRVATGDQFIANGDVKENIIKNFGAFCTEMEGAAIAHTAFLNEIPFVIIRAISDKADGSAEEDYPTFEKKAAERSAKLVESLIVEL